jgi:hypothetical protein
MMGLRVQVSAKEVKKVKRGGEYTVQHVEFGSQLR